MAAPVLTSVSPGIVLGNGGYLITITGAFALNIAYRIHIGPNGDTSDPACYAGSGLGNDIVSLDETTLVGYIPEMTAGEASNIYVQERDTPANNDTLTDGLRAVERDYSTSLWSMKSLFPPNRPMGKRTMVLLEAPTNPTNLFLRSEEFTDAAWTKLNCGMTDSQADPFGTSRGGVLAEDGTAAVVHAIRQSVTLPASTLHTTTVYVKAINRAYAFLEFASVKIVVDLTLGTITDQSGAGNLVGADIVPATQFGEDGWYRVSLTVRTTSAGSYPVEVGASEDGTTAGTTFDGLSQDSIRVAFPVLDAWCVPRMYRKTEGEAVT